MTIAYVSFVLSKVSNIYIAVCNRVSTILERYICTLKDCSTVLTDCISYTASASYCRFLFRSHRIVHAIQPI